MDELTTTLFEEAHEMVAVEKAKRATAERLYTEAKHKVDVRGERACF
jgi:low affinity Fe/Cu permease